MMLRLHANDPLDKTAMKILADSGRADVRPFRESLVVEHDTDFVVRGERTFTIRVERGQPY